MPRIRFPPIWRSGWGRSPTWSGLAITNTDTSARLLSQATSDPLTGLLNHRAFQERVESEVGRAQRYGRPLSLVLLDLDYFKTHQRRVRPSGG